MCAYAHNPRVEVEERAMFIPTCFKSLVIDSVVISSFAREDNSTLIDIILALRQILDVVKFCCPFTWLKKCIYLLTC